MIIHWVPFYHTNTLERCNDSSIWAINKESFNLLQCVPKNHVTTFLMISWTTVSHWNAWPATGRSALQDLQSCVILQASLALSPVSSSICCTHVRQGRPRWRFHSGLMSGLTPARASTARGSAEWAGVASGSRCTWPKMESCLQQSRIAKPSSPVWLVTEAFMTKWNQQIPKALYKSMYLYLLPLLALLPWTFSRYLMFNPNRFMKENFHGNYNWSADLIVILLKLAKWDTLSPFRINDIISICEDALLDLSQFSGWYSYLKRDAKSWGMY